MKLILQIIGKTSADQVAKVELGPEGGSIGRQKDNDWVLDDPYVSRHHAAILADEGGFYVEDRGSGDGTYVNDREGEGLEADTPYRVTNGDRLYIGDFEILVSIAEEEARRPRVRGRAGAKDGDTDTSTRVEAGNDAAGSGRRGETGGTESGDDLPPDNWPPDDWPPGDSAPGELPPDDWPPGDSAPGELPPDDWPPGDSAPGELPPDNWPPGDSAPGDLPPDDPARHDRPERTGDAQAKPALEALLRGARIEGVPLQGVDDVAVCHAVGVLLRETVTSLSELMELRTRFKEQFLRVDATRVSWRENNPLKVSELSDDQILRMLFSGDMPQYQPLPDAVAEALDDTKTHLFALVKGMQSAFDGLLGRLDPNTIEQEAESNAGNGFLAAKGKPWDYYRQLYGRLADADFYETFGKEFADAYQEVEEVSGKGHRR